MAATVRFAGTHDGLSIAYRTDGDGPPLVFVRGWITHLETRDFHPSLRAFFERLSRHLSVVTYDARGNGLSDRTLPRPPTWDDLQADLVALMHTIDGPVVMWGSCFGGPIAIRYAAEHPDQISRLILDGTFAFGPTLAADHRRDSFLSLLRLAPSQPDAVFASLSYLTDPEPGITHEARVKRLRASIEPELLEPLYSLIYDADVRDEASALAMPTLVLHRFGSRSVSAAAVRALAARIADVRFVTLQGKAQNLWEEDSESALAAIGEFLGLDLGPEPTVVEPVVQIERQPARLARGGLGAVLFTDMEASTATTTRLGDDAAHELVRAHNRIVREALAARGASEIKHTGDGIMAWTPSISGALSAATAIQHAIGTHAIERPGQAIGLKIGISAGEPLTENDDLFGSVVQLARRACDAGRSGDVLVTTAVHELAQGKGFAFDAGTVHRLKGFDQPVTLWRLELREPPKATAATVPTVAPSNPDPGVRD